MSTFSRKKGKQREEFYLVYQATYFFKRYSVLLQLAHNLFFLSYFTGDFYYSSKACFIMCTRCDFSDFYFKFESCLWFRYNSRDFKQLSIIHSSCELQEKNGETEMTGTFRAAYVIYYTICSYLYFDCLYLNSEKGYIHVKSSMQSRYNQYVLN